MPATTPLRHPKECRRRKCNNGEIPHATLRKSICIFEEKVLAKNMHASTLTSRKPLAAWLTTNRQETEQPGIFRNMKTSEGGTAINE